MQKFSLQTLSNVLKQNKSLFLGFVDIAMVNANLPHKEAAQMAGTPAMKNGKWYCLLQNQLLQLNALDFTGVVATRPVTGQKHRRAPVRHTHAPSRARTG